MSAFTEFERAVLEMLLASRMGVEQIGNLLDTAQLCSLEHTGVGYYLTVRHPTISNRRVVCHKPLVRGKADGVEVGFVAFLEHGELTLECHSFGDDVVPDDFRNKVLEIWAGDDTV